MGERTCICIPTYMERDSLPDLIARLEPLAVDCLVIDDDSPDGTGQLAEQLRREHPWLHVLHHGIRAGLGGAYRAGFAWALARDYALIGQMDADGQHPPELIPALQAAAHGSALVVASRYLPGGGSPEWSPTRRLLSRTGGLGTRLLLDLRLSDPTGGYRLWRRGLLEEIDFPSTAAEGFVFQIETAYRAQRLGAQVSEVPYVFAARRAGESKMSGQIAREGLRVAWRLRRDPWRPPARKPAAPAGDRPV